jgi:hypothetical protein
MTADDPGLTDDPAIIAMLADHDAGWLRLPEVHVEMQSGVANYGNQDAYGPVQRDYSNVMHHVPERGTALYVGGSHQTYRANDVWEYHLGSNTWRTLFGEGGNHARFKPLVFALQMAPTDTAITDEWIAANWDADLATLADELKGWWRDNGAIVDRRATTSSGGPFMPSHQWDGVAYDARTRQLTWISGGGVALRTPFVAWLEDISFEEAQAQLGGDYRTWSFSPSDGRWSAYDPTDETPRLAGMGASLTYIPDECRLIYYVAASNVSPGNFRMAWWDRADDSWSEIRPVNGSVWDLAASGTAPGSEAQMVYVPRRRTLYAALGPDLFAYSLDDNEWSLFATDTRINAHDAHSVFGYDAEHDALLYLRGDAGPVLAAFPFERGEWEILDTAPWQPPRWGAGFGYFDPLHGVLVIARDSAGRAWVYRYAPSEG